MDALAGWACRGDPERGVADGQLGDEVLAIADAVQHGGAEGGLVERDGLGTAIDPQFGLDGGHGNS